MPLSPPVDRELYHTRQLTIQGYKRADGLWDIEAQLCDTKPFAIEMQEKHLPAHEPVHQMWLRLTVDRQLLIHQAEAFTKHGPYTICANTNAIFAQLKGISIGPGWLRQARANVPRTLACTHIFEMLNQIATTAMQTMWGARDRDGRETSNSKTRKPSPGLINSCLAWRVDSAPFQRGFPDYEPSAHERAQLQETAGTKSDVKPNSA